MGTINHGILESYAVPAPTTAVPNPVSLRFSATSYLPLQVRFENEGEAGQANFVPVLEDSADGSSWADVSGGTATVVAGGSASITVTVRTYLRIKSSTTGSGVMIITPRAAVEITRI